MIAKGLCRKLDKFEQCTLSSSITPIYYLLSDSWRARHSSRALYINLCNAVSSKLVPGHLREQQTQTLNECLLKTLVFIDPKMGGPWPPCTPPPPWFEWQWWVRSKQEGMASLSGFRGTFDIYLIFAIWAHTHEGNLKLASFAIH